MNGFSKHANDLFAYNNKQLHFSIKNQNMKLFKKIELTLLKPKRTAEYMSSKEFVEQPPDYFDRLFQEALKKADLTVKERKRKWKKYQ